MVRGTVEETLNAMLDAEADQFCGQDTPELAAMSGTLQTSAGEALRFESYRRRESSVEEVLVQIYLAGISVRRVEDINEAMWATRVSPSTVSNLYKKIRPNRGLGNRREGEHQRAGMNIAEAICQIGEPGHQLSVAAGVQRVRTELETQGRREDRRVLAHELVMQRT